MNLSEIKNAGAWKNEGYNEEYELFKGAELQTLTLEHIPVEYEHDKNLSTSFQMRHVVDSDGNRGFMCFVGKEMPYMDTYRQGTTQEVYDEVKNMGILMQQQGLRRAWLNLNRR